MTKRIGVLTSGGDAPGLNAVLRAVVKTAMGVYGWEVYGILDGFHGLLSPPKLRRLLLADVRGILPRGGTILGTSNRGNPFAFPIVEDGQTRVHDRSPEVFRTIQETHLGAIIVIGGDGSLRIAQDLAERGLEVIGVPKTIDNDLACTDVTFGFDSALTTATEAIDKLRTTAESHHRAMLLEVMGRDAGWIGIEAGLAGGADIILIPEIPFTYECICATIRARQQAGQPSTIIVVSEGAAPRGGERVWLPRDDEETGNPRLGGIGYQVGEEIQRRTGLETRVTVLGHLQRGGSPSPFDRILATRFGSEAVEAIARGETGRMVALQTPDVVDVPLADAVGHQHLVPADGELVRTARNLGVSFGDELVPSLP